MCYEKKCFASVEWAGRSAGRCCAALCGASVDVAAQSPLKIGVQAGVNLNRCLWANIGMV